MRKRMVALLAAALMALCIAPVTARAEGTTAAPANEAELLSALEDESVGTIALADDITLTTTALDVDRALTLDLNGHTLSVTGYVGDHQDKYLCSSIVVEASEDLTLINSASNNGILTAKEWISVYGTLRVFDGVSLKTSAELRLSKNYSEAGSNSASLYMEGGSVETQYLAICDGSKVYADAGEVDVLDDYAMRLENGVIAASDGSTSTGSGTVFRATSRLELKSENCEVSYGTYECKVQIREGSVTGGVFNNTVENAATIAGGTFNAAVANQWDDGYGNVRVGTITGGLFNDDVTEAYTITFDSDGGTEVADQVRANAAVTKPENPVKQGYAFMGWYNGDTEYDFSEELEAETGALTLTAKWGTCVAHSGGSATCVAKAVCEVCGSEYGEVDPDNHASLEHMDAKGATYDATGNIEYWYCSSCGKYFSDADATKEIKQADTVVAKKAKPSENEKTDKRSKAIPQTGDDAASFVAAATGGVAVVAAGIVSRKRAV